MKSVNRWLGAEIVLVQVGHGLMGAALLGVVAANVPWWFTLALAPLVLFSLLFWLYESSFVLPVARRMLTGEPETEPAAARGNDGDVNQHDEGFEARGRKCRT